MPRNFIPSKHKSAFEPMEQTIGQDTPRILHSEGDARDALDDAVIVPVERPMDSLDHEKLAMLKFMEDELEIHIHSTSNKFDEQIFEVFINGKREVFRRNETKKVKRYFVDRLARLKPTTFTQREVTTSEGVKDILFDPHTGLKYPFSVRYDPHPRGNDWLRSVLAEA